jgi:hypothetical protein
MCPDDQACAVNEEKVEVGTVLWKDGELFNSLTHLLVLRRNPKAPDSSHRSDRAET